MKKAILIILSVVFLGVYLGFGGFADAFDDRVMATQVLSQDEIDALCALKKDAFMWPELTLNGGSIPYDIEQNMLLIPQNMSEASITGTLEAADGELYFLEDENLQDKALAMSENKVFRLFWIREEQCWMYNVYFTGMPVINIVTNTNEQQAENFGEQTPSTGVMEIHDPYHSTLQMQSAECSWHRRGSTTLQYEKASYKLTLTEEKLSLLGMRKDDDWILHALYDG